MIARVALLITLLICCAASSARLAEQASTLSSSNTSSEQEVLYLPDGRGLSLLSFGYTNFVADLLWFNTINYFGKHYNADRNFQWLGHMCNLVTSLDPNSKHVYGFCSTMLSWEANLPNESLKILDKAIANYPTDWKFFYLRGFTKMFFLKDDQGALADFSTSAKLPGASWIAARLAAKNIAMSDDPKSAVEFLKNILEGTTDETQRRALESRLREAQLVVDLDTLAQAVAVYKEREGQNPSKLEELVKAGIILALPLDPFGGKYLIDEAGQVSSTSSVKLPKFFKKRP